MKKTLALVFFVAIFPLLMGCTGLPININFQTKDKTDLRPSSVNIIVEKGANIEKITPEIIERIQSLIKAKLAERNVAVHKNSSTQIRLIIKKYRDGDIFTRSITGFIFGINFGEPAKIDAKIIILKNQKKIVEADISVESSRSGWNFAYGYIGADGLENVLAEKTVSVFFETIPL